MPCHPYRVSLPPITKRSPSPLTEASEHQRQATASAGQARLQPDISAPAPEATTTVAASKLDASSLTLVVVSAPASCASPPHQSDVEASALVSLGLVFKHEVRLLDRPADVFSVAASDSILK